MLELLINFFLFRKVCCFQSYILSPNITKLMYPINWQLSVFPKTCGENEVKSSFETDAQLGGPRRMFHVM